MDTRKLRPQIATKEIDTFFEIFVKQLEGSPRKMQSGSFKRNKNIMWNFV